MFYDRVLSSQRWCQIEMANLFGYKTSSTKAVTVTLIRQEVCTMIVRVWSSRSALIKCRTKNGIIIVIKLVGKSIAINAVTRQKLFEKQIDDTWCDEIKLFWRYKSLIGDRTMIKTVLKKLIANLHIFNSSSLRWKLFFINFEATYLLYHVRHFTKSKAVKMGVPCQINL